MAKYEVITTNQFNKDLKLYDKDKEIKVISLERTGTHSDLFKKK